MRIVVSSLFQLNTFESLEDVANSLTTWVAAGTTNMAAALRLAGDVMFTPVNGDRVDVPNYVVLITDGRSDNRTLTVAEVLPDRLKAVQSVPHQGLCGFPQTIVIGSRSSLALSVRVPTFIRKFTPMSGLWNRSSANSVRPDSVAVFKRKFTNSSLSSLLTPVVISAMSDFVCLCVCEYVCPHCKRKNDLSYQYRTW